MIRDMIGILLVNLVVVVDLTHSSGLSSSHIDRTSSKAAIQQFLLTYLLFKTSWFGSCLINLTQPVLHACKSTYSLLKHNVFSKFFSSFLINDFPNSLLFLVNFQLCIQGWLKYHLLLRTSLGKINHSLLGVSVSVAYASIFFVTYHSAFIIVCSFVFLGIIHLSTDSTESTVPEK